MMPLSAPSTLPLSVYLCAPVLRALATPALSASELQPPLSCPGSSCNKGGASHFSSHEI